ncbi:Sec23-binding domain of Sec16-domain-containing protein [Lipomyces starkeyi]
MDADGSFTETTLGIHGIDIKSAADMEIGHSPDNSETCVATNGDVEDVSAVNAVPAQEEDTYSAEVTDDEHPLVATTIVEAIAPTESEPFLKKEMTIVDPERTVTAEPTAAMPSLDIGTHAAEVSIEEPLAMKSETNDLFQGISEAGQSDFFSQLADGPADTETLSEAVVESPGSAILGAVELRTEGLFEEGGNSVIGTHAAEVSIEEPLAMKSETNDLFQGISEAGQSDFFSQLADRPADTETLSEDVVESPGSAILGAVELRPEGLFEERGNSVFDNLGRSESTVTENMAAAMEEATISFGSPIQDDDFFFTSAFGATSNQMEQLESHPESTVSGANNTSFDFLLDDNDFLSDDEVENASVVVPVTVAATSSYAPNSYAPSPYNGVPQVVPVQQSVPPKPKAFFEDLPALSNPKIVRRIDQFAHRAVLASELPQPPPATDLYGIPPLTTPSGAIPSSTKSYGQPTVASTYASAPPVNNSYTPQPAASAYNTALVPPTSSYTNRPQQNTFTRSTASDAYDPPFISGSFVAPRLESSAYIPPSAVLPMSPQTGSVIPHPLPLTSPHLTNTAPTQSKYVPVRLAFPPPTTSPITEPPAVFPYTDTDIQLPKNILPDASSHYTPTAPSTATPNASYASHVHGAPQPPTTSHYTPAAPLTTMSHATHASNEHGAPQPSTTSAYAPTTGYRLPQPQASPYPSTSPPTHPHLYSDIPPIVQPKSASVPPHPVAAGRPPIPPARTSSYAPPPRDAYSSPPPLKPLSTFTSPPHSDPYSTAAPYSLPQSHVPQSSHLASSPPQPYPMPRSVATSPQPPKSLTPQPHPLMSWSSSGKLVTIFPSKNPNLGYAATNLDFVSSTIKVHNARDVIQELTTDINMAKFPGPLCAVGARSANKSKKKDVLKWMDEKIPTLEKLIYESIGAEAKIEAEDNLALWKCVRIVLDSNGELDTTASETRKAIRHALIPELVSSNPPDDMATFTSASDIYQKHIRSTSNGSMGGRDISDPKNVEAISSVRELLLKGDREGAVASALDSCLWAHALLIASTISKEKWKDTAREFIRADVLALNSADASSLAAVYEVFAGCGDEAVDTLLPPGMTLSGNEISQQAPAQLTKWRETLAMILLNRSGDDIEAIASLGKLLASYGHTYAAHTCYIFARPRTVLGGREDFTLLGGDYARRPSSFTKDLDVIILSEIYELAVSLGPTAGQNTIFPHLQLFKYQHARILAENGFVSEARKYLDYIGTAIKATSKTSFVYDVAFIQCLRELSQRLSETPASESRWLGGMIGKPSLGNMWGNFDRKLAQFVAGDDEDPSSTVQGADNSTDGRFRKLANSPGLSRQQSTTDMAGLYISAQNFSGTGTSYTPPTSGGVALHNSRLYGSSPSSARTSLYMPQNDGYGNSMENSGPYGPPVSNTYAPAREQTSSPHTASTYALPIDGPKLSYAPPTTSYDSLTMSYEPRTKSRESAKSSYEPPTSTYNSYESELPHELPRTSSELVTSSFVTANDGSYHAPVISYGYEPPRGEMPFGYEPPSANRQNGESGGQIDMRLTEEDTSSTYARLQQTESSYEPHGGENVSSRHDDFDDDEDLGLGNYALSQHKKLAQGGSGESDDKTEGIKDEDQKEEEKEEKPASRGGWFSWLHRSADSQENKPKAVRAKLGEGMQFVYDKELKKWVNPNDRDAGNAPSPPPPPPRSKAPTPASTVTSTAASTPSPARLPASAPATPMTAALPPMSIPPRSDAPPAASSAPPSNGPPLTGMPSLTGLPEQPAGATRRGKKRPQYIPPPAL